MTRPPSESTGTARLAWTAAFLLAVCLAAVALVAARIAAHWGQLATLAAAGVAALLLLLTLVRLLVKHRAAVGRASWRAAETGQLAEQVKQYSAELAQRAADSQQLQAQLQRCMSELDQREDQRRADLSARSAALGKALDHLIRVQLPLAFSGSTVPPAVPEEAMSGDSDLAALCTEVVAAVSSGAAQLHEQLDEQRETARLAVVSLARRVQASAHRIQEEATRMAERHPADPDVLESSMRVDHAAAQQARHAQSMAVLCGEWPGQQWSEPLALVDVARAAAGRIVPYQRVSVSGDQDVAAAARIAEPLIHLVAELLANATQSSPPASEVLVTVRTVQRGAVIEIDDGGVGMDEHRLEQAREVATGRRPATLTSLGEIPQTGLAVVGQYARRHGLSVDLVPSPYGGIRAVTLIPAELVQVIEPAVAAPAREPARHAAPAADALPARDVLAEPGPAVPEPAEPAAGIAERPEQATAPPLEPVTAALPEPGSEAPPEPGGAPAESASAQPAEPGGGDPLTLPRREPARLEHDAGADSTGLPQRRSRRGEAAGAWRPRPAQALPDAGTGPLPSPAEVGAWMGAFLSAGLPADAGGAGLPADAGGAGVPASAGPGAEGGQADQPQPE